MSPHLSVCASIRPGSSSIRALPFVLIALSLGLLLGNSTASAQTASPSWQPARKAAAPNGVASTQSASRQNDGWHSPSASKGTVKLAEHREPVVESEPAEPEEIDADAAFGDAPKRTVSQKSKSLQWQPQNGPAGSARKYPAEARTNERTNRPAVDRQVSRIDYEFEDPPAETRARPRVAPRGNLEPEPEQIETPRPVPRGQIVEDPTEIVSDDMGDDGDLLGDACGCCEDCGHCACIRCCRPFAGKLWVRGEYLLWWSPGYTVPALLTTGPSTSFATAGQLGQSGTSVLFGNDRLATETRSGLRITAGYLLMPCRDTSIEGSYTTTGTLSDSFSANSNAYPVLARPYFNIFSNVQGQAAHLIAFPTEATGSVSITASSEFNSADAYFRRVMRNEHNYHIDFLCGYRYARLDEKLGIIENQTITGPRMPFAEGTVLSINDTFNTLNEFNGGQIGFVFMEQFRRWSVEFTAKMAVGNTRTQTAINGSTTQTGVGGVANATLTYGGGVLAQPSNIGLTEVNSITVMPEFGLSLSYNLNRRLKLSAGYNFLYWSKVARPGDQIDFDVNSSQLPPNTISGASFPKATSRTTDFWMQGVSAGLEYRF